jgi:hypothetical protein
MAHSDSQDRHSLPTISEGSVGESWMIDDLLRAQADAVTRCVWCSGLNIDPVQSEEHIHGNCYPCDVLPIYEAAKDLEDHEAQSHVLLAATSTSFNSLGYTREEDDEGDSNHAPLHNINDLDTRVPSAIQDSTPIGRTAQSRNRLPSFASNGLDSYFRNDTASTATLQHRREVDAVSLISYKTAKSSLASYSTARSDPHSRWGTSLTRQFKEGERLNTLSENISGIEEMKRGLPRTQKEFEALVDLVRSCVMSHFGASNVDQVTFRETIHNYLRGQHLAAPHSGEILGLVYRRDDENSMKQSTAKDVRVQSEIGNCSSGAFNQLEDSSATEKENSVKPLDELMDIVAGYMPGQSNTGAFKFADQKHRETLRAQLCFYIDQYRTGAPIQSVTAPDPVFSSEWLKHLHQRGILLEPKDELNWSGRGQHIEYGPEEEPNIPLQMKSSLGHGTTAVVESVQCRRILLVRKTIKCNRRLTKEDVIVEVEHLQ